MSKLVNLILAIFFAIAGWNLHPNILSFVAYFFASWFMIGFIRKLG
jgi:hypothetical protein